MALACTTEFYSAEHMERQTCAQMQNQINSEALIQLAHERLHEVKGGVMLLYLNCTYIAHPTVPSAAFEMCQRDLVFDVHTHAVK